MKATDDLIDVKEPSEIWNIKILIINFLIFFFSEEFEGQYKVILDFLWTFLFQRIRGTIKMEFYSF